MQPFLKPVKLRVLESCIVCCAFYLSKHTRTFWENIRSCFVKTVRGFLDYLSKNPLLVLKEDFSKKCLWVWMKCSKINLPIFTERKVLIQTCLYFVGRCSTWIIFFNEFFCENEFFNEWEIFSSLLQHVILFPQCSLKYL